MLDSYMYTFYFNPIMPELWLTGVPISSNTNLYYINYSVTLWSDSDDVPSISCEFVERIPCLVPPCPFYLFCTKEKFGRKQQFNDKGEYRVQ